MNLYFRPELHVLESRETPSDGVDPVPWDPSIPSPLLPDGSIPPGFPGSDHPEESEEDPVEPFSPILP